jgi:N-dimethylarginine dimethylaminohydrolase
MPERDFSEYSIKPELLIVHDPTEFDAFQGFSECRGDDDLLGKFLFRERPDAGRAHAQHVKFVESLKKHVEVKYLAEILGNSHLPIYEKFLRKNPNHMYTHDAIITIPWVPDGYILANMRKEIRRNEPAVLAKVAEILGLNEILTIPSHLYLEGGDVMPFCYGGKRALLMGYGPRTSIETLYFLREILVTDGIVDEIVGFKLAEWRLNLDGCFFPVSDRMIVSNPGSMLEGILLGRDYTRQINPIEYFRGLGFVIVEATREESYQLQACNFVCLEKGKLAAYNMTERINNILRDRGLEVIGIEGDQLVKGNGGPHCMTRPVYKNT